MTSAPSNSEQSPRADLAVVFTTQSAIEASVVRALLDSHGIHSAVTSAVTHALLPLTVDGQSAVRIAVRPDEADAARRIIESSREGADRRLAPAAAPDALERSLGYRFRDRGLLEHALTHRSRAHEDVSGGVVDNESLEFLGDAVLGFVIADLLFHEFPDSDEGEKSKLKAALVSAVPLAQLGANLQLGEYLLFGRGEEKSGGRSKQALVANGYEALIAAIYLDGGVDSARAFIHRQFRPLLDELREGRRPETWARDHKSALQEWLQSHNLPLPEYRIADERGPDHRKVFRVDVRVRDEVVASADGRSKKEAEQRAAARALDQLTTADDQPPTS